MKRLIFITISILFIFRVNQAAINFTGDVSVDFDQDSYMVLDQNGDGDVTCPYGITSTGWDFHALYLHYDRNLDRLYIGLDFAGRICGDADGNGNPSTTGSVLQGLGGQDVANLGNGETVCIYFNTNLSGNYDVICGVAKSDNYTQYKVCNSNGNPNNNPENSFGSQISAANGSYLFASPGASQPDFECTIFNFSQMPGFNFDPETEDCQFRVGAYAGSYVDDGIGNDIISNSQILVTFFSPMTIPHALPRDLYVMQGIPVVVPNGDPDTLFAPYFNNAPPGWPYWRVSRWDVPNQTYVRYQEPDWPVDIGQDPPAQDPGKGFWVVQDVVDSCQLWITGDPIQPGYAVLQHLAKPLTGNRRGLTQLACPFHVSVTWGDAYIKLQSGQGSAISIESAVAQGKMCRYAVTWDPFGLQYVVNDYDATITPWTGYWTEQYDAVNDYDLYFDFPETDAGSRVQVVGSHAPREVDDYGEWSFSLGVYSEGIEQCDFNNFIGIISSASDQFDQLDAAEYMPQVTSGGYFHLYFPHQDWELQPGNYSYDFRTGPFDGSKTWIMDVRSDDFSGEVIIIWDGIFKVAPEYSVSLLNDAGDTLIVDMRNTNSYAFTLDDDEIKEFQLKVTNISTEVENGANNLPAEFSLSSAYPNPFNNSTRLNFNLCSSARVNIVLYDVNGHLVQTVLDNNMEPGPHSIKVNGEELASGIYFLLIKANGTVFGSQKLVLLK